MQQVIYLVGDDEEVVALREFDELAAAVGREDAAAGVLVGGVWCRASWDGAHRASRAWL